MKKMFKLSSFIELQTTILFTTAEVGLNVHLLILALFVVEETNGIFDISITLLFKISLFFFLPHLYRKNTPSTNKQ